MEKYESILRKTQKFVYVNYNDFYWYKECLQNVKDQFLVFFSLSFFDPFYPSKQTIFSKEKKLKETYEKHQN